ncbi:MAG: ABC transporter permease [Tannerella sp.]|jgi:ABC-type antimicrobial peptide transport system permease subunit|nr:ABC transporter permease [Tannerella sp.]
MIRHYFTVALRNLQKYKTQTFISLIGLAAGFICFAYCSYGLHYKMDWHTDMKDFERICFLYYPDEKAQNRHGVSYDRNVVEALAKTYPEVESHVAYIAVMPKIGKTCEIQQPNGSVNYFKEMFVFADAQFIDFFDIQFLEGSMNDLVKFEKGILLTEKTALKMFGTRDVIGKTFHNADDFTIDNEIYTIRGVIRDFPERSNLSSFGGIDYNTTLTDEMGYGSYNTYVKLNKGTDLKKLNQKLNNRLRYNYQSLSLTTGTWQTNVNEIKVQLKPISEYYEFIKSDEEIQNARIFFVVGFLVLLTALLNYIIFISGRVLTRIRECGVRKVAGSDKYNLFLLFFSEALAVYLLACLAGFFILELSLPLFKNISMFSDMDLDYLTKLFLQYGIIGLAVIALLCLAITYRLIRIPIIQSISGGIVLRQNNFIRNTFLFVQFFICFLFIGGSWFIHRQSKLMQSFISSGLSEDDQVRTFYISLSGDKFKPVRSAILSGLKQNPKIEAISRNGMGFFNAWEIGKERFTWNDISEAEHNTKIVHIVTDSYYTYFMKTKTKSGRFFEEGETDKMVVNESFAKLVNRNPTGMEIGVNYWGNVMQYYQVVGVLPDMANYLYDFKKMPVYPCLYLPYPDGYHNLSCYVKVIPGYENIFSQDMEKELRKYVNSAYDIYIQSLKESTTSIASDEQDMFKMTTVFSSISIIITLLGMYASVMLATEKRHKEVTIRKIYGATPLIIIMMFCKNIYLLLGASACAAFPVVIYLLNGWLSDYAIRINIGLLPFIILFLLMASLVTAITIGQIISIARTNPAEAIKD